MNTTSGLRAVGLLSTILMAGDWSANYAIGDGGPGKLLIYYSYPSSINGTFSVPAAAAEFGQYDYVVIGDGLQSAGHPDHANTVSIISHATTVNTKFFGYIDLGVSTQNLSMAEIQQRMLDWAGMGVVGILLDDFGYDWGVTRDRQNAAVDFAHANSLRVIANGWVPADVFGAGAHANNPMGTPTHLNASDFYLFESHQIIEGAPMDPDFWFAKAEALVAYQETIGFEILSITTIDAANSYSEVEFFYSWYSAAMYGHEATGWGEYIFSAITATAPFRTRPTVDVGQTLACEVTRTGDRFARGTELGTIVVDAMTLEASFVQGSDADADGDVDMADFVALQIRFTGPGGP